MLFINPFRRFAINSYTNIFVAAGGVKPEAEVVRLYAFFPRQDNTDIFRRQLSRREIYTPYSISAVKLHNLAIALKDLMRIITPVIVTNSGILVFCVIIKNI